MRTPADSTSAREGKGHGDPVTERVTLRAERARVERQTLAEPITAAAPAEREAELRLRREQPAIATRRMAKERIPVTKEARRAADDDGRIALVRYEEQLDAHAHARPAPDGVVRAHTTVERLRVDQTVPRGIVHADVERTGPEPRDDGQVHTLADGSLSIPVLEEQIVVTRRTVVRERVIVRKRTVTEHVRVQGEVCREHVTVESTEPVHVAVRPARGRTAPFPGSSADPRRRR